MRLLRWYLGRWMLGSIGAGLTIFVAIPLSLISGDWNQAVGAAIAAVLLGAFWYPFGRAMESLLCE